ncbi:MAG: amino acid ABC transporter ATP-binding protein [Bifidobacteriaceae bacterium]|jgi:polar amino acid transport system ATP-binding protein|nr:amino acid ABC transporter ATP-binding protein [Bifidobacteriaceae bacterium]
MNTQELIRIEHLNKTYENGFTVLEDVTVNINRGDVISVIGASGTGKTTFIRLINRLDEPSRGSVILDGVDLSDPNVNIDTMRMRIGMVFQSINLFEQMSVTDNITIGQTELLKRSKEEAVNKAKELLKTVGLVNEADSFPEELSDGQRQRIAIARALAMDPEIMLLDEPTSALDPMTAGEVVAVLRNLANLGTTMVVVTHNMSLAKSISNRIFYMDEKGIYEDDTPKVIFENPQKPRTKEFIFRVTSFNFALDNEHYDYIDLRNKYLNFASSHGIDEKNTDFCRLLIEELATILPKKSGTEITFSLAQKTGEFELIAVYSGVDYDILSEDNLSVTIIRNSVEGYAHKYVDGANRLALKWGRR